MTVPSITLHNGVEIPQVGLGVFLMEDANETDWAVKQALHVGYRHFDTAAAYGNEEVLGKALKEGGITREDLFITSKLWNNMQGYEKTKIALQETLDKLGTDYLDLYLIHWYGKDVQGSWQAMEELYEAGKIKAIGVSNFMIEHLESMKEYAKVKPMINQIETHPYFPQNELHGYMKNEEIVHEAWGPLSQGKSDLLMHPVLKELGEKYGKTSAQIVLRWHIERDTVIIPKSVNPGRIAENISLFDFELTSEDMEKIAEINVETRFGRIPNDHEFIEKTSKWKTSK